MHEQGDTLLVKVFGTVAYLAFYKLAAVTPAELAQMFYYVCGGIAALGMAWYHLFKKKK